MIKPDVIVTWPKNCDYPLWRQFIRDNRSRFNKVIIAFMEPNSGYDFKPFIQEAMWQDNIKFLDAPIPRAGIDDWRDLAVNASLLQSQSDWIWFTEQDFYPCFGFWEHEIQWSENNKCDVIAAYQSTRMHPCCMFVKRMALDKTHKNFGIVPDKTDHFYLIQKDLEDNGAKIGKIDPKRYHHYNGLSHNWRLVSEGGEANYQTDDFVDWLKQSLTVNVPQCPEFERIANAEITRYEAATIPADTYPDHFPTAGNGAIEPNKGDTP